MAGLYNLSTIPSIREADQAHGLFTVSRIANSEERVLSFLLYVADFKMHLSYFKPGSRTKEIDFVTS